MKNLKEKTRRNKLSQRRVRLLRDQRNVEKGKIKEAIFLNKKQEAQMTKFEEKQKYENEK